MELNVECIRCESFNSLVEKSCFLVCGESCFGYSTIQILISIWFMPPKTTLTCFSFAYYWLEVHHITLQEISYVMVVRSAWKILHTTSANCVSCPSILSH
ncbi:hypothetical protein IC582_024950 [Cucumis melo]